MEKVFVYGTLREGGSNHGLMGNSKRLGKARTAGRIYSLGNYPGAALSGRAGEFITGEVYGVDGSTLRRLDALEGHPGWYTREKRPVVMDDGSSAEAWIYLMNSLMKNNGKNLIQSGDWIEFHAAGG